MESLSIPESVYPLFPKFKECTTLILRTTDGVKGGLKLLFYGGLKMYDLGGLGIDRCQTV